MNFQCLVQFFTSLGLALFTTSAFASDVFVYVCETGLFSHPSVQLTVLDDDQYTVKLASPEDFLEVSTEVERDNDVDLIRFDIPGTTSSTEKATIAYNKLYSGRMRHMAYKLWIPGMRGQSNCDLVE